VGRVTKARALVAAAAGCHASYGRSSLPGRRMCWYQR
jgi:hypothetical protein